MPSTLNRIPTVNRTKQLLRYSTPVSNQGYEAAFNSLNVEISHISRYGISHHQQQEYIYSTCKRFLDVFAALLGLIILAPVFLIIAILIKLDSEGPILFKQARCGKGGQDFTMYKFRTMVKNAESKKSLLLKFNEMDGSIFKMKNDPRLTRVGKWLRKLSLDELPQLVNILKGEMSLVGPRPLAREELTGNAIWRKVRLSVKPGLTGSWQIHERSLGSFEDMVKWDLFYVNNQSLLLDSQILLKTPKAVLSGKGAY
jgi:lipopolysaccharide/colanic/teichoic acid biosynthesis glycosyltransferase